MPRSSTHVYSFAIRRFVPLKFLLISRLRPGCFVPTGSAFPTLSRIYHLWPGSLCVSSNFQKAKRMYVTNEYGSVAGHASMVTIEAPTRGFWYIWDVYCCYVLPYRSADSRCPLFPTILLGPEEFKFVTLRSALHDVCVAWRSFRSTCISVLKRGFLMT